MRCAPRFPALLLLLALLPACGDSGPSAPGDGDGGSAAFRATIQGQPWAADGGSVTITPGSAATPGSLVITGTQVQSGGSYRSLVLLLAFLEGPGTYPLGVNVGTTAGGTGLTIAAGGGTTTSWQTALDGAAGTVTVTELTAARIKGTFAFQADPVVGGGAGVTVSNGSFDVALPAGFTPAAGAARGSFLRASLGGAPWNGATVLAVGAGGTFGLTATNTSHIITINPTVVVSPGTYTVGDGVTVRVQLAGSVTAWGAAGSTGSVTFTAVGDRIVGSFSGVLAPMGGAGGTLTVTGGAFDVRLGS